MIERQVIAQKMKEKMIEEFVFNFLGKLSCSKIKIHRTPLGEKISVYTSRPGLIVGKKGVNIKELTSVLKEKFHMENPQIEVAEIINPDLDAATISRSLLSGFERFGPKRFKAMAYRAIDNTMKSGAKGVEIVIAGRGVPGERAKTWRFSAGYLKKSGDISAYHVDRSSEPANLKSGTIGVSVSVLHPDVSLPDDVVLKRKEVHTSDAKSDVEILKQAKEKSKEGKKEDKEVKENKKEIKKEEKEAGKEEMRKKNENTNMKEIKSEEKEFKENKKEIKKKNENTGMKEIKSEEKEVKENKKEIKKEEKEAGKEEMRKKNENTGMKEIKENEDAVEEIFEIIEEIKNDG